MAQGNMPRIQILVRYFDEFEPAVMDQSFSAHFPSPDELLDYHTAVTGGKRRRLFVRRLNTRGILENGDTSAAR